MLNYLHFSSLQIIGINIYVTSLRTKQRDKNSHKLIRKQILNVKMKPFQLLH